MGHHRLTPVPAEDSTTPLARALRQARSLAEIPAETVANVLDCSLGELAAIEAGAVHPDEVTIAELAQIYGLSTDRLGTSRWVPRSEPRLDADERVLWIEWLPISCGEDAGSNAEILATVANHLRFIRSLRSYDAVRMRVAELDLLVSMLDRTQSDLVLDFARAMRLPWREAAEVIDAAQERVWNEGIRSRAMALADRSRRSID